MRPEKAIHETTRNGSREFVDRFSVVIGNPIQLIVNLSLFGVPA